MVLGMADISDIPLCNPDHDGAGTPEPVQRFKHQITQADALLIATPEYNRSIPGVLKNAIDWASWPYGKSPMIGKPTAILGAATGNFGTLRAQMHLRQVLQFTRTPMVLYPEVLIARAAEKFDDEGRLTDEQTRELIRQLLDALHDLTLRLAVPSPRSTSAATR
jgi:chromate reductase